MLQCSGCGDKVRLTCQSSRHYAFLLDLQPHFQLLLAGLILLLHHTLAIALRVLELGNTLVTHSE